MADLKIDKTTFCIIMYCKRNHHEYEKINRLISTNIFGNNFLFSDSDFCSVLMDVFCKISSDFQLKHFVTHNFLLQRECNNDCITYKKLAENILSEIYIFPLFNFNKTTGEKELAFEIIK